MNLHLAKIGAGCVIALACAAAGLAQPAAPHLGFVYPAGGQQGTTFTVSVGGQNLNGASAAMISGAGTAVRVVGYERPLTQKEINDLREETDRLQEKRTAARADATKPAFTADDEKRLNEIRQLLATRGNRQAAPVIAETVTLEITLAPDASVGDREMRVRTPGGVSNPLVFCVGQLPETTAAVVTSTSARPVRPRDANGGRRDAGEALALPALVNGQILPGEVDRFRFDAKQGQRLTFAVSARTLMPYLADAVPGWFQATLALFDSRGRELAYADDYRFSPDPVFSCEIPTDGAYTLEIKDALFRGREDFVYRIALGELPFITSVFPLGSPSHSQTSVALSGWNLPCSELAIDTSDQRPGVLLLSVIQQGQFSNSVKFAVTDGADSLAAEPNDSLRTAQPLGLPAIVNGRIERPGDEDFFRFDGRAGETVTIEVLARRLGSPLDSVIAVLDEAGRALATNDDTDDKGAGLLTHHADSRLLVTLPSDGAYVLRLADTQHQGGPEYGYRLRVSPAQPDFELRVVPSTINVRAGATVPITVHALRRDGFNGEIELALRDTFGGFVLSGTRIPSGVDALSLTLTAPLNLRDDSPALTVVGRAQIGGVRLARAAVPADDMMQAFAYHHLVTAKELRACVVGRGATVRPLDRAPVSFPRETKSRVRLMLPMKNVPNVAFEVKEPSGGFSARTLSCRDGIAEVELSCDTTKVKPGTQGNLILQAFGERPSSDRKTPQRTQRFPIGLVQAIPFSVPASTVASR